MPRVICLLAPGDGLAPRAARRADPKELRPIDYNQLADDVLSGGAIERAEALAVLRAPDDEVLDLVAAAGRVRRAAFGNRVKLNYLVNMKSGLCGEDCSYCSQRRGSAAGVLTYNWISPEAALSEAERAANRGARRVCLVASGRGPSSRDLSRVAKTVGMVREALPSLEICVCLGLLDGEQAAQLKAAGADAYNHNLNTAEAHYGRICSTHSFDDRVATVRQATRAGLSPCSGVIVGMGESDEELVDVGFSLRELAPSSVPVNFLMPFPGTPLEGRWDLTPLHCLRVLAMFRFLFPKAEVRIAGGREMHLRGLQTLGLHIANSIFLGDYLTSEGAPGRDDLQMIADAGFVVEGAAETAQGMTAQGGPPSFPGTGPESTTTVRRAPSLRRRGAGTALPSNA